MLSVLALSIGLGFLKNSSYYKNTTPQADLDKVIIVRIERAMTGVGEVATIDKILIQNLIKATQIGVYKQLGPLPRNFSVDCSTLSMYSIEKGQKNYIWGCSYERDDLDKGRLTPEFTAAVKAIVDRHETYGEVMLKLP